MFEWRYIKLLMRELWYNLQDKGIWESYDQQKPVVFWLGTSGSAIIYHTPKYPFCDLRTDLTNLYPQLRSIKVNNSLL